MQVAVAPWFVHLQNGDSSLEIKGKEQSVGGESRALGRGSQLVALPAFPRPCGLSSSCVKGCHHPRCFMLLFLLSHQSPRDLQESYPWAPA